MTIPVKLMALNDLVGGYIEGIGPSHRIDGLPHWYAYLNEHGKLDRLPLNPVAMVLMMAAGRDLGSDFLVGPVVFLGSNGDEEADVPDELLILGQRLGLWEYDQASRSISRPEDQPVFHTVYM